MRRRDAAGWSLATMLLVAFWWWWRVLLPEAHRGLTILNYDLYAEVVPRLEYAFGALAGSRLPLWNPHQLAGTPFLATQQHGVLYPLNAPHLFLPLPAALSLVAVLHYTIAALGTAALARDLGASRLAAGLAAVAFAASGSMFGRLYLPPHLYAAAWLPLQILLARRLYARGVTVRRIVALALVFALQFVGGYAQYTLFAIYLVTGYFAYRLALGDRARAAAAGAAAAAALCLAAALGAAQLLPTAELMLESPRQPGALDVEGGARAADLLRTLLLTRPIPGVPEEATLGLVVVFLALVGVAGGGMRRLPFLAGALFVVLALATNTGLDSLASLLPGYAWFRMPTRILVVAVLFVSLLAAAGIERLRREPSRAGVARACLLPMLLFAAAAASLLLLDPAHRIAVLWSRFAWLGAAALLLVAIGAPDVRAAALVAVAVLEMALLHRNVVVTPYVDPDFYRPPAAATAYIREHQGWARTLVAERLEPPFQFVKQNPPKTGMLAGLYAVGDYENLYPRRYALYLAALQRRASLPAAWQGRVYATSTSIDRRLLALLGVRFVLTSGLEPFATPGDAAFPRVFQGIEGSVLENAVTQPRAFLASAAVAVPDTEGALALLRQPSFDLAHTITVEGAAAEQLEPSPSTGSVEILGYEPERVVLRVRSDAGAFAVLTDQDYPGWTAQIDGEEAPILRADGVFRAVRVPAGEHLVEMRFAPVSFRLGAAISLLALGGLLIVVFARRRRQVTP